MNYKLFTRIVLFLSVYLSFSVNSFAWDSSPTWDEYSDDSYADETLSPGVEKVVKKWYSDKPYRSELHIPYNGFLSCKFINGTYNESQKVFIDQDIPASIKVGFNPFSFRVFSSMSDNPGYRFRTAALTPRIECKVGNEKWRRVDFSASGQTIYEDEYLQNRTYYVSGNNFDINLQKVFNDFVINNNEIYENYKKIGEIDLKFRFVYYLKIETENTRGNDEYSTTKCYFHTPNENVLTLKIYQCNVGELSVDETKNPSLGRSEDGLPFYAIYPKQSGSIDVTSDISYNAKSQINDVISYNEQIKKTIPIRDNSGTFELKGRTDKIGISNFYTNQNLNPGDIFTVKREVEVRNVGTCKSPAIKFKVVDPVHINIDADTSYQIECYTNKKSEYVTIYGEDLSTQYDVDLYKPEYRWEGKKGEYYAEKVLNQYKGGTEFNSDGSLREDGFVQVIEDEGTNKSELRIPNIALEEGKTYYFRQRVYLKGFGKDIYERGEKVYAVKIAKKFDPKKLKLNIDTNGVRLSKVCYGEYLDNVTFSATYGDENENPEDYNLEKFSFNYEIAGQKNSSTDKVNQSGSFNFENNIIFKVVMKNGCGDSIIKYDSITVQSLPVLSPNNIVKVNSDVEVEYFDDHVQVTGISGRECKLTIDDKEFSVHDYFYYQQGGKETKISPNMRTYFQSGKQEFFVYKKDKNGNGCKSNEIKVIVIGRENIRGNRFIAGLDTIYVCPGSNVPTLNDSHITIPEAGDNIEFSYKWIYSTNGYTYLPVRNVVGDETILITEPNLSDWKQIINSGESVHIKRVVSVGYNLEDPDNSTILGSDTSNAIVVTTFSDPKIDLELVGDKSLDKYCFGDTIDLKMSVDDNFVKEYDLMTEKFNFDKYSIDFYDYTTNEKGEYVYQKLNVLPKDRFVVDGYYNLHVGLSYCNDTLFTEESQIVQTHDKLDLALTIGKCVIVGDSVDVRASLNDAELAIILGNDTLVKGSDEVTTQFYISEDKNLNYKIFIKDNNTGCENTIDKTISASIIEQKKNPVGIGVNGIDMDTVCAGSDLYVASKNVENDKHFYSFSWKVDGIVQQDATAAGLNHKFTSTGSSHVVERTANYYKKGEFCYSVTDTMRISTFAPVAAPKIEVSADAVCHGGEVTVTATAKGGGQNRGYKVLFSPGEIHAEETIMEGESLSHTFVGLNNATSFSVEVSDERCSSKMYKSESEDKLVKVEKDLAFSVSTTSKIITLEDFKDNAIKILFNFDGITTGDSMSYRVNGGKEVMFLYDGTALSLTLVDSTDFASGNVHLDFVHYGSVAGCSSEIVGYDITINEGFDGIPNITSAGIEDTIEVCAGTDVEMELSGLDGITFDEKPIEEMTDGVWTWYRNNSPVAGGSANGCVVKAEAGKSKTYYARFSAKDAGGKTRRLWSNPFTVIGKAPIKLEKIKFDNYQSQDFVEFCKGSNAKVTIASSQTFGKEVTLQWQYSENTADWADVPASWNGGVQTVGVKSISVPVSVLGDKTTWFRLSVTDTCGQLAESNLLKVQFKGDVLSPSPVLTSTRIYDSESDIPVALEFARSMNHSPYRFLGATDDEGELEVSEVGGRQSVGHKDGSVYKWSFGENIVRAVGTALARVSNEVCYSDTVEYKFKLFKKLGTPQLTKNPDAVTAFCPGDADMKYLYLHKIVGGDSLSYKTYWQYSMDDVNWYAVREGDNDGLFSAQLGDIDLEFDSYSQNIAVSHLKQTISFRAVVDCEGGYPGTSVMSNMTQTFRVYSPMSDGGIDDGKITVCYASVADSIKGKTVEGGSGRYIYEWQWSKDGDDESWEDVNCTTADFGVYSSNSKFALTEKTFFRRVVTDEVCGTTLKSGRKEVDVKTEMILPEDYVHYSALVPSGNAASMQGLDEKVQKFIWYNSPNVQFATSVANEEVYGEPLEVPLGDESMVRTYYVQGVIDGCPTTNKLPLKVLVYNQSGGDIMFDGEDYGTSSVITCSGYDDIELLSVSDAPNAKFKWYYSIGGGQNKQLQGIESKSYVTTPSVRLDTVSGLVLAATEGRAVNVRIFRVSEFSIEGTIQNLSSDTLTINIVPTLQSVNKTLKNYGISNLAGEIEIKDGKMDYCLGEHPNNILGFVDQGSALAEVWNDYKNYFGPWLFDNEYEGGFRTYYEYSTDGETWMRSAEYDYSDGRSYAGDKEFSVTNGKELDATYTVRRVLTDGCTSVMSEPVALRLMDGVPEVDSIGTYGLTPEMPVKRKNYAIRTGYEIGDSIIFENGDPDVQNLAWFADAECTDTLCVGESWCSMVLDSAKLADNGANMYVQSFEKGCFGETVAVPFEYGTLSSGGRIVISDTVICQNGAYGDILGETEADGWYVVPRYEKMQWRYSWQYKWSDSKTARWSDIAGVNTIGLSSEVINSYVKAGSPLYIRRVAVNEKGRVRYSNELRLTHYTALIPGSLIAGDKLTFCTYDELPYVKTTSASGGKVSSIYGENWQYSINGGPWSDVTVLDSLYLGRLTTDLDKTVNNEISIRCLYSDDCDVVSSEEVTFTFYRYNTPPTIYQNNDSCNSTEVKLAVYQEDLSKTYRWSALYVDPSDPEKEDEIWFNEGENCTVVRSHLPTSNFGVKSTDLQTGCVSEYFRFTVDSLPELEQALPIAPLAVCPGEDLTIKGGALRGGNSDKSYRWQLSTTGNEEDYSDIAEATSENMLLESKYIKSTIYVRRIVEDMCSIDTSASVKVELRDKVEVKSETLILNDYKCENSTYTVKLNVEKDSSYASEFWVLGTDTLTEPDKLYQMVGFEGESQELSFARYLTDSTGLTCSSEAITIVAHNKPAIDSAKNKISTENLLPCNDSYVEISGENQGDEHITYKWFINGVEQIGKTSASLSLRAADTMLINRVMTNGCEKLSSNTIVLVGQRVYDYDYKYDFDIGIVTQMQDSSVTLNISKSHYYAADFYFIGDGIMPEVTSNNVVLPYNCEQYKDSVLDLQVIYEYCFRPLSITPLRGGTISFDGDTVLCGGADVPAIVVTEISGGSAKDEIKYQWQYKNIYTPDFINIDGATNKTYVPQAIDVETVYRRVTTNGIYSSISNELTLSIQPLPSVLSISNNLSKEEMKKYGLNYGKGYFEWLSSIPTYLIVNAEYADELTWEKSMDGVSWVKQSVGDSLEITDSTEVVYYRLIASSLCGKDTSDVIKMISRFIDPINGELQNLKPNCYSKKKDDESFVFKVKIQNDKPQHKYSISIESECDGIVARKLLKDYYYSTSSYGDLILVAFISQLKKGEYVYPPCDFTLNLTRHDTLYGLSISESFFIHINTLEATYSIEVENGEEFRVGEKETILLAQGNRVQFREKVSENYNGNKEDLSYQWVLEEPLNTDFSYQYGGRMGLDGLTSELPNPSCYYYNGGRYPMKLVVTDGECTSEIRDTSLYLPEESVRSRYNKSFALEGSLDYVEVIESEYVDVNPRLITDHVIVSSTNPTNVHSVKLVDELSREVWNGSFSGSLKIQTENLISGVYFIIVDETKIYKLIKK